MENKFNMSRESNIIMAKRLLVDVVYKSANLEGIAVTFAQTNDIINNVNINNVKPSDVGKVCCLRDAWRYTLENVDADLHLGFIEELHQYVAKSELPYFYLGNLRREDVIISGTLWRPEIPDAEKLHQELQEHLKIENDTDRALTVMLWLMRSQMFMDGNKRVALMIGNKMLIQNGKGIISVPVEKDSMFKKLLVRYYETNDMNEVKQWLWENCLEGTNPTFARSNSTEPILQENDGLQPSLGTNTVATKRIDDEGR